MKPFRDTKLGKLPPEIRQIIFTNLLAYGGSDQSPTPLTTFVDLRGSCLAVLKTCRQIYTEAFPVFYASKSYYVAKAQDLVTLLGPISSIPFEPGIFRLDTIASLCLRNVVINKPKWTPESIDRLVSRLSSVTRERLRAERINELDSDILFVNFRDLKSLRKLYLCFQAGQESEVLRWLFNIQDFGRGVIDFMDDFHWSIRWQNVSRDEWNQQYPGFSYHFYRHVGSLGTLDSNTIQTQKERLNISSRASDLTEGQERWIEIDIGSRSYEDTKQYDEELVQHYKEWIEDLYCLAGCPGGASKSQDDGQEKGTQAELGTNVLSDASKGPSTEDTKGNSTLKRPEEGLIDFPTLFNSPAVPSPSTLWPSWSTIISNNGNTQTQVDLDQSSNRAMDAQGGSTSDLPNQPRRSTQPCTTRSLKSHKLKHGNARKHVRLVPSKKCRARVRLGAIRVQKKLTETPTAPESPRIPLATIAAGDLHSNPILKTENSSLHTTNTKVQLRAVTLILALSLAYVIQSEEFEEMVHQMLIMYLSIFLFFTVVKMFSEESG